MAFSPNLEANIVQARLTVLGRRIWYFGIRHGLLEDLGVESTAATGILIGVWVIPSGFRVNRIRVVY